MRKDRHDATSTFSFLLLMLLLLLLLDAGIPKSRHRIRGGFCLVLSSFYTMPSAAKVGSSIAEVM